ncbi:MAG TPA: hypothetical protein PKA88_36890, partial [Polyangiaceae bacterium]|nr:hypothetical protein [Polyangiaceae bacterium]
MRRALSAARAIRWAALAGLLLWPQLGAAQEKERVPEQNGEGMDTHLFRPAVDSKGFMAVNGSDILGANDISFGLVLDYRRNIMRPNEDRGRGEA